MIKRFLMSGRSGFSFSVIEPGEVALESRVEILSRDANPVAVADIVRLYLPNTRRGTTPASDERKCAT
jgi:MOSC domain-containing protein YiiM